MFTRPSDLVDVFAEASRERAVKSAQTARTSLRSEPRSGMCAISTEPLRTCKKCQTVLQALRFAPSAHHLMCLCQHGAGHPLSILLATVRDQTKGSSPAMHHDLNSPVVAVAVAQGVVHAVLRHSAVHCARVPCDVWTAGGEGKKHTKKNSTG